MEIKLRVMCGWKQFVLFRAYWRKLTVDLQDRILSLQDSNLDDHFSKSFKNPNGALELEDAEVLAQKYPSP